MTLLRLALRSHRTSTIVMAAIGAFIGMLNAFAYAQIAGTTPAERHLFAAQMALLGKQFSYILPAPLQLDTMGGYLAWRNFSTVTLVFSIWAVLAATGAARGDEERGLVEEWLATGVSRARWLVTRTAGFLIAAGVALAATVGVTWLGTVLAHDGIDAGASALEWLVMLAPTLVAFAIGIVIAQLFITRRVAASVAAIAIIGLFLLNAQERSGIDVGAIKYISTFYLFDRSTPLLQGGAIDASAITALLVAAIVLIALAILGFVRRDVGGSIVKIGVERARVTHAPSRDPFLRAPVLAGLDQQRWWIVGWAAAIAALAYLLTSITRALVDSMAAIPAMRVYLERAGMTGYTDTVGLIWFSSLLLIIAGLVIVQVNGWAADDAEGRLDAVLAASASRSRVVVERIVTLLVGVAALLAVSSLIVGVTAQQADIPLPSDRLALATVLVLPMAFAFAGVGHLLVGWRPRLAVLLLGAVAVVSYFTLEFQPLFEWPEWVKNVSLFALYGNPLTKVDWSGIVALVAIGTVGTAAALVTMGRRDVGA